MSRSNAAEILENPAKLFAKFRTIKETIKIDGDEVEKIKGGTFVYFDKSKGENGENVEIKLPLKFAILNMDLVSFKGYDEANKRGVWSNEVNDGDQTVVLKTKGSKLLEFKRSEYKNVKDKLASYGAKFTSSVYIAVSVNGGWEIWNLQLSGSALSGAPVDAKNMTEEEKLEGWFNFTKNNRNRLYSNYIEVTGYKPKKKGSSKFVIPVYELGDAIDEADVQTLNDLDKELNTYLDYYFQKPEGTTESKTADVEDPLDY